MATVQYGRLHGPHGFVRSVAIKRLHPQFAKEPDFVAMFLDEARLSARLAHANIVATLDVIDAPDELALVMEYVHGESLWNLLRLSNQYAKPVPVRVATALTASVLHGLQAAHITKDDHGEPLRIVHRDVSPHNILVGSDGLARIIDFGIAKAVGKLRATPSGEIKGKLIYMAPEQLSSGPIDPRADVYGAAAVLWEVLTGKPPFDGPNESAIMREVLQGTVEPPGRLRREVSQALDGIVMRGLSREPDVRFETALSMALALEHQVGIASQSEVSGWLHDLAGGRLAERSRLIAQLQEAQGSKRAGTKLLPNTQGPQRPQESPSESRLRLREDESSPSRPSSKLWLGVVAAAALGAGAAWFYFFAGQSTQRSTEQVQIQAVTQDPAERPGAAPSGSTPEAELVRPRLPDSPPDVPVAAQEDLSAPPRDAPPRGIAAPNPTSQVKAPGKHPLKAPTRATQAADPATKSGDKPDCRSWFYIDESGIRHPKPGCLE
jgi:serine/threonine-protein kinase